MLKNMTVKMQLSAGFGIVIVMLLVISSISILGLRSLDSEIDIIVDDRWPKTVLANDIIDNVNIVARALRNAILQDDRAEIQKELGRIEEAREKITGDIESLQKTVKSEHGKELMKKLTETRNAYLQEQNAIIIAINENEKEI